MQVNINKHLTIGKPTIVHLPKINLNIQYDAAGFYTEKKPIDLQFLSKRQGGNYIKTLKLYELDRRKKVFYVPRTLALSYFRVAKPEKPDAALTMLYPQQWEAVKLLLQQPHGILASGVGSGKSYMIAAIAELLPVKSLVISPGREIAQELERKFKLIIPHIKTKWVKKQSDIDDADVAIMVHNTVSNKWQEWMLDQKYKAILIDEIHDKFAKPRVELSIKYKYHYLYGFTGTPTLGAWDSAALWAMFNNRIVNSGIRPSAPQIYYLDVPSSKPHDVEWYEVREEVLLSQARNMIVLQTVKEVMNRKDRRMGIMFVDSVPYAKAMARALNAIGVPAEAYTGEIALSKRKEILEELTKKRGVMVATYQTAGQGFDRKPLNTAFFNMLLKFEGRVKQAVGRILRGADKPELYDFFDKNLYVQKVQRLQAYREEFSKGDNIPDIKPLLLEPNCGLQYKMGLILDKSCLKYEKLATEIRALYYKYKGNEKTL